MKIYKPIKIITGLILAIVLTSCNNGKAHSELVSATFEHDGLSRDYIYYSPGNIEKHAPLVVVLHGFTGSAEKIMNYSKLNALAKENHFTVVYPQGTMDADSNTFWNVGYDFHKEILTNDVDFIVKLIQFLQNEYSLSKTNTFITGMSNGGEMCYLMACQHSELFRAAAPVAGMMLEGFFPECKSNSPIPIFAIFGTNDPVTRYEGDLNNGDGWGAYPDIPFTINYWAKTIQYSSFKSDTLPDINKADSSFIVRETYLNDINKNEILYYKVINGGHEWPGVWGNMDINASTEIWKFFEKYLHD
jgi:polyhydroxybutyrate depolymerase